MLRCHSHFTPPSVVSSPSLTSAPPHMKDRAPSFTGRRGASALSAPIIEYDD